MQVHEALIKEAEEAGKPREAQRLRRCAQPHSGGFITALPSKHDGFDTILMPKTFRTAVYYRLGIPVLAKEIDCPTCKQTINIYGDHATCCTKTGDLITRHNAMRNLVESVARDGKLAPELEKKGILGSAPGRRPGDVTIPGWNQGRALALDIAVTSLSDTNVRLSDPCYNHNKRLSELSTARARTTCARSCALPRCTWAMSTAPSAVAFGPASLAASNAKLPSRFVFALMASLITRSLWTLPPRT